MRRKLSRLVAVAALLSVAGGCSKGKIIPAVGPSYEIVVLSPPAHRELGKAVSDVLSREIHLVQWEPTFVVIDDVLDDDPFYRSRKMLFAVAPAGDEALRKIMKRAGGTKVPSEFPGLWIVRDPFASGQVLFVLTGEKSALEQVIAERSDELLAVAEDVATTLLMTNVFRGGEQEGARDRMLRLWGWGMRLPPDWKVDSRFAADGFVRIWRDAPVEQIFVAWEKGETKRSPADWLFRRDELTGLYYQGDLVTRDSTRTKAETGDTPFGPTGVALSGVWENEIYVIGGPFVSWIFHCAADDRTYFIDLSVYAPDRDKRPLLRNLEAVARTFRCACVPEPGSGPAT